jgi:hypothetical protein
VHPEWLTSNNLITWESGSIPVVTNVDYGVSVPWVSWSNLEVVLSGTSLEVLRHNLVDTSSLTVVISLEDILMLSEDSKWCIIWIISWPHHLNIWNLHLR